MYQNNALRSMPVYLNNHVCLDSDGKITKGNSFFEVLSTNGQYILIQDDKKLAFNCK